MTTNPEASAEPSDWVGISDAADQAGVAAQTVRNWIAAGSLTTRSGQGPRGSRTEVSLAQVQGLGGGQKRAKPRAKKATGGPAKKATATAARGRRRADSAKATRTPAVGANRPGSTGTSPGGKAATKTTGSAARRRAEEPRVPPAEPLPETDQQAAQRDAAINSEMTRLLTEARQALSTLQHRVDQMEASLTAMQQARASAVRRRLFGR
jgi:hypothetical protein